MTKNLPKDYEAVFPGYDNLSGSLSLEEEQVLAKQIQEGSVEARNELVEHNLRWIIGVAVDAGRGLSLDKARELAGYALETVLKDAEGFRPQGVKFISYLAPFLYKRLLAHQGKEDSNGRMRLPHGMVPIRLDYVADVLNSYPNEEGWVYDPWSDRIADETAENGDALLESEGRTASIDEALRRLPKREEQIMRAYFLDNRKLADIGTEMGLEINRVKQYKAKALLRLATSPHRVSVILDYAPTDFKEIIEKHWKIFGYDIPFTP